MNCNLRPHSGADRNYKRCAVLKIWIGEMPPMWRNNCCIASAVAALALLGVSGSSAAAIGLPTASSDGRTVIQRVHSVYEAEETLHRRGYYDIRLERATLPYSFNACKRGVRYHVHVDYYGDLVGVDELGPCSRDEYDGRGRYYDRYRDRQRY